jgi:polysaccharide biosynthesis protein PslH
MKPIHPGSKRLLFLLPFAPRLDAAHGGGRVMAQRLAALLPRHRVAVLYFRAPDEPPADDFFRECCEVVEEVNRPWVARSGPGFWRRNLRRVASLLRLRPMWVTDWASVAYGARVRQLAREWRPDIVQIEYHVMGQYLPALDGCPAPRILTEYEPGTRSAPYLGQPPVLAGLMHRFDQLAWRRFEPAVIRGVQAVIVFTQHDRQAVEALRLPTPVRTIPLGTVIPAQPLDPLGGWPLSLLFVGNFIHPPNVDAAMRLARTIFPAVRRQYPELELYIVGNEPPPQLKAAAGSGITVIGWVPDVTPYLAQAAVCVAPLRLGGGMRVKMLEALAAGKAIVASSLAAEGLDLTNGEQLYLAETDADFVARISQLLKEPERRTALAGRARLWACANLGWESAVAAYEALYEELLTRAEAE